MKTIETAVWQTITLGKNYKKSPIFVQAMRRTRGSNSCPDTRRVPDVLQHPAFVTMNQPIEVELIRTSLEDLGYKQEDLKDLRYEHICERGLDRGWAYCPAEVGVQVLVQHSFADNQWLTIAMKPIPDQHGFGQVLRVYDSGSDVPFLTASDSELVRNALKGSMKKGEPTIIAGSCKPYWGWKLDTQLIFISGDSAEKIKAAMAVPWKMKVWRQVTLTTKLGRYPAEFPELLEAKKIRVGNGSALMKQNAFVEVFEEQTVDVVRVSVRELGGTNYTRYDEICEFANVHELDWCPPQLAPELLLQCPKATMGDEDLIMGMRSIRDGHGCPGIFKINRDPERNKDLGAIEAHPDTVFHPSDVFLFIKRKKKTAVL